MRDPDKSFAIAVEKQQMIWTSIASFLHLWLLVNRISIVLILRHRSDYSNKINDEKRNNDKEANASVKHEGNEGKEDGEGHNGGLEVD